MLIEDLGLSLGENTPTGMVEISSLKDHDVSVGNRILELMAKLTVSIPSGVDKKHPRLKSLYALQEFLGRKPADQLGYGQFDTPKAFLSAFTRRFKRASEEVQKKYKAQLPLMYIARNEGVIFSDTRPDIKKACELERDGSVVAEVDAYITDLDYQLNIIGWDEEVVSMLALHILTELRSTSGNNESSTNFADTEGLTFDWSFKDTKTLTADGASVPFSEGRLHALSISFTIEAEVGKARYVSEERAQLVGKGVIVG